MAACEMSRFAPAAPLVKSAGATMRGCTLLGCGWGCDMVSVNQSQRTRMAARGFGLEPTRRTVALAVATLPFADPSWAQDRASADPRGGTVRIYLSIATSAAAKLVTALKVHFPNLKIEFVRAGSVETVRRFVAERQAGRIGADLIHGADPGGFEYFSQKGWLDRRLAALALTA